MATKPPLNTDIRVWALEEIARLEAENAALKEELANRPGPPDRPPGGGPPPDWERPPAIPQKQDDPESCGDPTLDEPR